MRMTSGIIVLLLGVVALAAFMACRADLPTTTEDPDLIDDAPTIQSVFPANGAHNVSRNSSYYIKFDRTMDTLSVSGSFHLIDGSSMQDWMDSYKSDVGSPGMGRQHMADWLDSIQCPGHMDWSPGLDSCRFDPDSLLLPDTDYCVFFSYGACDSSGAHMQTDHLPYEGYMYHFRTRP